MSCKQPYSFLAVLCLLTILGSPCAMATPALVSSDAEAPAPESPSVETKSGPPDPGPESFEDPELLLFEEFPTVVSAGRLETPSHTSSVPVSTIDHEVIHASGLTAIADLLQFVPGVDVLEIDRNRFAIGVHGLHDTFSERTLSMIDGSPADSAIFGGSEFLRLPIFPDDIERIEVVRGPGGAAWGANAFTGVIHIITREPEETQGGLLSTTFNEFGDQDTYLRWGDQTGDWYWRVASGFNEWTESSDALDSRIPSRDFGRRLRANTRAARTFADGDRLTLGLSYSTYEQGAFELLGFFPDRDGRLLTYRGFARLERQFAKNVKGYAQWQTQFTSSDMPTLQENHSREHGVELQLDLTSRPRHDLLFGGNARALRLDTDPKTPLDFTFANSPINEWWFGLFASDRFRAADRWTVEAQARIDDYSGTGTDWSGRLSVLRSLDSLSQQVLRLSVARAFRAPTIGLRAGTASRFPIGPGLFGLRVLAPQDLDNEETWSLEAGYAISRSGIQLRIDVYRQEFDDLIGFLTFERPFLPGVVLIDSQAANLSSADSHGASIEFTLDRRNARLSAWYTWNDFEVDDPPQVLRAYLPAEHKAGLRYLLRMPSDWTLQTLYRYSSMTNPDPGVQLSPTNPVDSFHRLDLTMSKGWRERFEWTLGIEDIFNETELAIPGLGSFTSNETPGRNAFIRAQWSF